jgi:hypothetical protein
MTGGAMAAVVSVLFMGREREDCAKGGLELFGLFYNVAILKT